MPKPRVPTRGLFDPPEGPQTTTSEEQKSEAPPPAKIKDACPRCGGRSQKAAHPMDHGGKTHYCLVCLSEDRTEMFYFTPVAETFVEQVEREQAKREAREIVEREVETEVVGEGEQVPLLDKGESWHEHWKGMPEFVQEDLAPWKSIYVHFESREDMEKFAKLVKQTVTLNTRSIWYPEAEIGRMATKRYVEGPVDRRTKEDAQR